MTRNLEIEFSVADMRQVWEVHQRQYDIVLACDNAIPHLLTEDEIRNVFHQFYLSTRNGGGCLVSVRDYGRMEWKEKEVKFVRRQVHSTSQGKIILFDIWEFEGE